MLFSLLRFLYYVFWYKTNNLLLFIRFLVFSRIRVPLRSERLALQ